MEQSILNSTKKILGVDEQYEVFDLDIMTHLNAAFGTLTQLGLGPEEGFMIEDATAEWSEYTPLSGPQLNMIKTYVYLKVRMLFDPPGTSFLLSAMNDQVKEYEWRLNALREVENYEPE